MNSGLLRALNSLDSVGEQEVKTEMDMVQLYTNDAMFRIINDAQYIVTTIYTNDELHRELKILRKLTQCTPANTAYLRRKIADAVIEIGRYFS